MRPAWSCPCPTRTYAAALADVEGVDVVVWDMEGPHERGAEVRLAVMPYMTRLTVGDISDGLDALEAVQIQSAGFEGFLEGLPPGVALCNAGGVHDASTAELALTLTLASIRQIPEFVAAQTGVDVAAADAPSGPRRPEGARARLRQHRSCRRAAVPAVRGVGHRGRVAGAGGRRPRRVVHGIDELPELAPAADVLVVIVPLTEATRGLVDAALLARLPDGALVVNVARGPVVDTDALVAECATGRLRAALDVTDPEPLPEDHPLWTTPGVLITPHVGGATEAMRPRAQDLIRRQVIALRDGQPLLNVVATG